MKHYELIQFSDGKYGIKESIKILFFKINLGFVDIKHPKHRWSRNDYFFKDCKTSKIEEAEEFYNKLLCDTMGEIVLKSNYKRYFKNK